MGNILVQLLRRWAGVNFLLMVYLTGSGVNPKTLPTLTRHPMIGALTQPASLGRSYVRPFRVWAADNGCFTQGANFDAERWMAWLRSFADLAPSCAFATAPDVVSDAEATWARSAPFIPQIRALGFKAALVAQDGIEDLGVPWGKFDALFLGGSTAWKLSPAARAVTREAKNRGLWVHMGRVNSYRRLAIAEDFGCDSVDGNYLGFGPDANLPRLLRWLERLNVEQGQGRLF